MFLSIVIGLLIILSIFAENLFYLLPIMVFAIIQSRLSCPHCKVPILKDKNNWYIFTMRTTCRHCGENTNICVEVVKEVKEQKKRSYKKKKK
jgi:hypothetical protein